MKNLRKKDSKKSKTLVLESSKKREAQNKRLKAHLDKVQAIDHVPKFEKDEKGKIAIKSQEDTFDDFLGLCEATSTVSTDLQNLFVGHLMSVRENPSAEFVNGGIAFLHGMKPKDELETMMLAQMFMTNELIFRFSHNLSKCEEVEINNQYTGRISRMLKHFREHMDALNKHRGKGQQKVTVEHVHVYEGGQAVVGHIEGGGGNVKRK